MDKGFQKLYPFFCICLPEVAYEKLRIHPYVFLFHQLLSYTKARNLVWQEHPHTFLIFLFIFSIKVRLIQFLLKGLIVSQKDLLNSPYSNYQNHKQLPGVLRHLAVICDNDTHPVLFQFFPKLKDLYLFIRITPVKHIHSHIDMFLLRQEM